MSDSRRYVFPDPGETIGMVAKRVLPDVDDGAQLLLSWNLHLAMRPFPIGAPGELLPHRRRVRRGPAPVTTRADAPVIAATSVAAGHDGRAELVLELAYPNGARTHLSVTEEAMAARARRCGA